MECSICHEVFNETFRRPRSVRCGHTFCEKCLVSELKQGKLVCPDCRAEHICPDPKSLPINYIAANLALAHREKFRKTSTCQFHPKEFIRFYCNSCNLPLCIECIVTHSGHEFVKQEESVNMMYSKCRELESLIEHNIDIVQDQRDKINLQAAEVQTNLTQELNSLTESIEAIKKELKNRDKELSRLFERSLNTENEMLNAHELKLCEQQGRILDTLRQVDSFVSELQGKTDEEVKDGDYYEKLIFLADHVSAIEAEPSLSMNFTPSEVTIDFPFYRSYFRRMVQLVGNSNHQKDPKICFFGDKNKLMTFNLVSQKWDLQTVSGELNYYSAAVSLPDGSVLITGGGASSIVYRFKEPDLTTVASMNQSRKEHAIVALLDNVYVIGGYDGTCNRFLCSCELFDGETWKFVGEINIARCAFSATSVNDQFIFIFGGYDGTQRLGSIERYDSLNNTWTLMRYTLKFPLSNCACFSYEINKVVVLGGGFSSGFSLSVEQLDIEDGTWRSLPMMGEGRDLRNKIVMHEGKAYCIGGYNFRGECFDILTESWSQIPNYLVSDNLDSWACAFTYSNNS